VEHGLEMFEISAVTGFGINEFVLAVGLKLEQIQSRSEVAI
jgi:hypothetical protein